MVGGQIFQGEHDFSKLWNNIVISLVDTKSIPVKVKIWLRAKW